MVVVPQVKCSLTRCTRSFSHRFGPCRCLVADAQVLRSVATLSTTIMYIPLVSTVIGVYNCSDTWEMTGWTCYAGAHLVLAIGSAVVILSFSCFSFVGTTSTMSGVNRAPKGFRVGYHRVVRVREVVCYDTPLTSPVLACLQS